MADKVTITKADVEAFSGKLHAWGEGLDAKEKALLHVLMDSAEETLGGELSDSDLEGVAGGASLFAVNTFGFRAVNIFSRFLGPGGLAAGGEVKEGGNPSVSGIPGRLTNPLDGL